MDRSPADPSALHSRATELFLEAVDLDAAERARFLATACGDDGELRASVERMLAVDDPGSDFLTPPPRTDLGPRGTLPIGKYCETHRLDTGERLALFRIVCETAHRLRTKRGPAFDLGSTQVRVAGDAATIVFEPPASRAHAFGSAASPEQVLGRALDAASDVYSLGVVLYEVVTGRAPYALDLRDPLGAARVVLTAVPEPPSLNATRGALPRALAHGLDAVLLKALRKDPGHRYATAAELSEALGAVLERTEPS